MPLNALYDLTQQGWVTGGSEFPKDSLLLLPDGKLGNPPLVGLNIVVLDHQGISEFLDLNPDLLNQNLLQAVVQFSQDPPNDVIMPRLEGFLISNIGPILAFSR